MIEEGNKKHGFKRALEISGNPFDKALLIVLLTCALRNVVR